MQITIDKDLCAGHGQCALTSPDLFEVDDDGYAVLLRDPEQADLDAAERAARACPAGAILVEQ